MTYSSQNVPSCFSEENAPFVRLLYLAEALWLFRFFMESDREKHRGREYGLNQVWDDAHFKTALF